MKRCPKCNADYFDNMLEFCLEDGSRLAMTADSTSHKTYPIVPGTTPRPGPVAEPISRETVVKQKQVPSQEKVVALAGPVNTVRVLEYAPLAVALAHNWWQWVYLEKVYVYSITDFLLSANFLMWALLFVAGVVLGVYSLKNSGNRTAAIFALVTLAINFILYLVPRR